MQFIQVKDVMDHDSQEGVVYHDQDFISFLCPCKAHDILLPKKIPDGPVWRMTDNGVEPSIIVGEICKSHFFVRPEGFVMLT